MLNEWLYIWGLAVTGLAVVGGILSAVLIRAGWRRLNARLDIEYGKKRR